MIREQLLEDLIVEIIVSESTIKEVLSKYELTDEESILLFFALAEMSVYNGKM